MAGAPVQSDRGALTLVHTARAAVAAYAVHKHRHLQTGAECHREGATFMPMLAAAKKFSNTWPMQLRPAPAVRVLQQPLQGLCVVVSLARQSCSPAMFSRFCSAWLFAASFLFNLWPSACLCFVSSGSPSAVWHIHELQIVCCTRN